MYSPKQSISTTKCEFLCKSKMLNSAGEILQSSQQEQGIDLQPSAKRMWLQITCFSITSNSLMQENACLCCDAC